jgi:hypothetical protein
MKLRVRITKAAKSETFRRCGLQFGREWTEIEVDDATARRLKAEQMLETADAVEKPAHIPGPEVAADTKTIKLAKKKA